MLSPVHPIDMSLYADRLSSPRLRRIWAQENILATRLHVEATLAEVQGELGMIPVAAAREIRSKASLDHITVDEYAAMYERKGQDLVALVWLLAEKCEGGWGEYVHWGSTSQDISWTATALMLRETMDALGEQLREVERVLVNMAERHATTAMIGRTHGQHGVPITFGFYLSFLAHALHRHIGRLEAVRGRLAVVRMNGALGTGAAYGIERAHELETRVAARLGLEVGKAPESEATRDNVAEFGAVCGMVATTFEKLARDVFTLQRPEIGELAEGFREGEQVGSSTLAHKRNPFGTAWIQGVARLIRAHSAPLQDLFVSDMRDGVRLAIEYSCLPALSCMTSALLRQAHDLVLGLEVHSDRMQDNLDASLGFLATEPIMMALATSVGRQAAHDLVYEVASRAIEERRHLGDVLRERDDIRAMVSEEELESLLRAENYLGTAPEKTVAAVQYLRASLSLDAGGPVPRSPWDGPLATNGDAS